MAAVERSGDVYLITLTEEEAAALSARWGPDTAGKWLATYDVTMQAIADGWRASLDPTDIRYVVVDSDLRSDVRVGDGA